MRVKGFSTNRGFTHVELVVALVIIAVAAAFATPNILKWRAKANLNGAARDLASDFQFAKMEAAKRNGICGVTFSITVDGTPFDVVVFLDGSDPPNYVYDNGEAIIRTVKFSDSAYRTISLDTSQADGDGVSLVGNTVAFNSRGLALDNTGSIIGDGADSVFIRNDRGGKKQIIVSPAGNIRIEPVP